eukprot:TRINITY_DN4972_c0_g1_i2.p1 TRINITY_DN4972_c0_g1~~TRINITY_DN4972_c0_g1_i2.p1  ORF type:complete len:331 (+),score=71.72 TRINITY_DN4972_c0_g1_i2:128-994(+)
MREVKRLVEEVGVDINESADDKTALVAAIRAGHTDILEYLISKGADINLESPILAACAFGHLDAARILIKAGVKVGDFREALTFAIMAASPEFREVVLDEAGYAGQVARFSDASEIPALVELLLDHGAAVNYLDQEGISPLHSAAFVGDAAVIRTLISRGATPDISDAEGVTPLALAADYEHLDAVLALLAAGADPKVLVDEDDVGSGGDFSGLPLAQLDAEGLRALLNDWDYPVESQQELYRRNVTGRVLLGVMQKEALFSMLVNDEGLRGLLQRIAAVSTPRDREL